MLFLSKFSHMKKMIVDSLFVLHFLIVPNSWWYHSSVLCPGYLELITVSLCFIGKMFESLDSHPLPHLQTSPSTNKF